MCNDDFRTAIKNRTGSDVKACIANTYDNLDLLIWAYENTPAEKGKIPSAEKNLKFCIVSKIGKEVSEKLMLWKTIILNQLLDNI